MELMLNADLGEGVRIAGASADAAIMPHIHQASIACGLHAGDHLQMRRALVLAAEHGVMVGAHPGYADRESFGRRSLSLAAEELIALLHYQIAALEGMAACCGLQLAYVKPHGALYTDMMANAAVRSAVMTAIAGFHRPLRLVLQATPDADAHRREAERFGIQLWFEAFADRCYADDGLLLPRSLAGAVHDRERTLAQVQQLHSEGRVTTRGGLQLPVVADTLCVHGDNPAGIAVIRVIRELLDQ